MHILSYCIFSVFFSGCLIGRLKDFGILLAKIKDKWPTKASDEMNRVLHALKLLNTVVGTANVFLGLGAGIASIAGAENLARRTAEATHQVVSTSGDVTTTISKTTEVRRQS